MCWFPDMILSLLNTFSQLLLRVYDPVPSQSGAASSYPQGPLKKPNGLLGQEPGTGKRKERLKHIRKSRIGKRDEWEKKAGANSSTWVRKARVWILPFRSRKALSITRKEEKSFFTHTPQVPQLRWPPMRHRPVYANISLSHRFIPTKLRKFL